MHTQGISTDMKASLQALRSLRPGRPKAAPGVWTDDAPRHDRHDEAWRHAFFVSAFVSECLHRNVLRKKFDGCNTSRQKRPTKFVHNSRRSLFHTRRVHGARAACGEESASQFW